ncbi:MULTISPECIES: glycosyltransferase family 4 protein [Paenibacillus]|uniref:glycosyltransferase family 4 protein n=1 Tax=Paenibacillus TaxID=44249 RepID=UPI0022B8BBE3|nr:glycosyltransferase family 4 protein [Paenibacillus caseinilyticus]MCZ8519328.1 glycosyltransferase family 4 protein [Paenibacillus caseinilyticus]
MKPKVMFMTNIPSPYRVDFFNELGKHCDLTVWFQAKNEANREWKVDGLGRRFQYKFLPGRTFGLDKHLNFSVWKELQRNPFDVYMMGCYSSPTEMMAIQWLRMRRIPFILNSDGGFPAPEESRFKRNLKRGLISSASFWLSSGKNCTNYLTYYGAKADQIHEYPLSSVYYSPEQLKPLSPARAKELKLKHGLKGTVFLSVGQFIDRKGLDLLLRSFHELNDPDASLLLIGGGPQEAEYRSYLQENRVENVVILPFLQKEELIEYYKVSDAFVLPTRYDVWALVLNEALMFGLPLISTEMAGAAHDLIEEGVNGYMIPADDQVALTSALRSMAESPERRAGFGARSLEIAGRYTMEHMVEANVEAINRFLSRHKSEAI